MRGAPGIVGCRRGQDAWEGRRYGMAQKSAEAKELYTDWYIIIIYIIRMLY